MTQQSDNMEIFKSKTRKMDNLKIISDFIDLVNMYHLKKILFEKLQQLLIYQQNNRNRYFILPEQQQGRRGCGSFSL